MFNMVFQSLNEIFDPNYVDTTPIPKQENIPDEELRTKIKKIVLESGMFEYAKNYKKIPIIKTIPSLSKLIGDLIKDEDYLQHGLRNLESLTENEDLNIKKKFKANIHFCKIMIKIKKWKF